MSASGTSEVASYKRKRNSDDMAWEFAVLIDPDDLQRVKCILCGKEMSGGVTRMKQHIAGIKGTVTSCLQATLDQKARCKVAHEAPKKRKKEKQKQEEEVGALVTIEANENEDDQEELNEVGKGAENVVQIVMDNASNNMGAKAMLKSKSPKIFWTSCATHTINLMVEAIGKLKQFAPTITKAKEMTCFLYAHHATLALMRHHTKKRDIVRPGVTRFASAFLTLQSLAAKRKQLTDMCCSPTWEDCKHTRTKKGKVAHATIMSRAFWKNVSLCIKVFEPLVKLLRLADSDGQFMASMYGQIIETKKAIMLVVESLEKDYKVITTAMESKMNGRLDTILHMAAYALNPYYSYTTASIFTDVEVMSGLMEAIEQFYHGDDDKQDKALNTDLPKFKKKEGMFGKVAATRAITNQNYNVGKLVLNDNFAILHLWKFWDGAL
ncbi:uncharacterized protein [Aegilops tauschii subsp. strangulata]|uniref:uncharacterized protein n=1 Tax=Aegilops tauschii subsp. strangulata TaxID=200361 RepID=UPI000989E296